jgi:hypothetical protein
VEAEEKIRLKQYVSLHSINVRRMFLWVKKMENKKYQTIGTVSKSNRKFVERPKLVLWTQTSPLIKNINK